MRKIGEDHYNYVKVAHGYIQEIWHGDFRSGGCIYWRGTTKINREKLGHEVYDTLHKAPLYEMVRIAAHKEKLPRYEHYADLAKERRIARLRREIEDTSTHLTSLKKKLKKLTERR